MTNEFKKDDKEKTQWAYLPIKQIEQVARVMDHGAIKYGRNNWRKGCSYIRMLSAAWRHIVEWMNGNKLDEESGLPHLAHAVCCLLFLMYYEDNSLGEDDR
jgi:hypothetical protein